MVRILLDIYRQSDIGVWVWGDWFPEPDRGDYKWIFNHRSIAGESMRPYFFDAEREQRYATPQQISIAAVHAAETHISFSVGRVAEANPDSRLRGMWMIEINGRHFVGFSRGGIFPRSPASHPEAFSSPPPTYFITDPGGEPRWAEIAPSREGWVLREFACATSVDGLPTPEVVLALAVARNRADFLLCKGANFLFAAPL